jgi:hypothetical protein
MKMALQITLTLTPGLADVKKDAVITTTLAEPAADEIYVGIADGVETRRSNEVTNAFKWLMAGIRDRKLLEDDTPDFKGNELVTTVHSDRITTGNRRTSSSLVSSAVGNGDIVLAMGSNVTNLQHRNIIDNAMEQLVRAFQEWTYANG